MWEGWNAPYTPRELREKVLAFSGRIKKQHWYTVEDFMLACGHFQVPIFIYHDWTDRHGEAKTKMKDIPPELISDGKTTEIFIPQGSGRALGIRRPGFILPFQKKCVCIFYKSWHFTWLKVRPTNNKWSKCMADEKEKEKVRILLFFKIQTYCWLKILLILAPRLQH